MRLAALLVSAVGTLGLFAFAGPTAEPAPLAGTFQVDPVHSSVLFKVKHNNAAYFYGRFADVNGTFDFDESDPSKSSLEVEVRAESVDSGNAKLDEHLRNPDFFDAKQFPIIAFKSSKVEAAGEGMYRVTGNMLLRGVNKEVTIDVEHTGTSSARGMTVMGFHTSFTIDRTDYGVSYGAGGPLGNDVDLIISIEAVGN